MICRLCPNECGVNRAEKTGACLVDDKIHVSYHGIHKWEEPVISGGRGSGAIFFSGCTMRCVFCQNAKISRNVVGGVYSADELAKLYRLYDETADNINLVSPTPYVEGIIAAADIYSPEKPVIYNTGGYERSETVRRLKDTVNVWLPDFKYVDSGISDRLSGRKDYFKYAFDAISQMIAQTGKPVIADGLIKSGVIVRHLIIPSHIQNTLDVIKVFSENFKDDALFSLMAQYVPLGVENMPDINRRITPLEYKRAENALSDYGVTNGFIQDLSSATTDYIPKF